MEKRFILWIILSVAIMVGWSILQPWLFPPGPQQPKPPVVDQIVDAIKKPEFMAALAGVPAHGKPFIPLVPPPPDVLAAKKEELRKANEAKAAAAPPAIVAPDQDIELGGLEYKLTIILSKQGAAVRRITLNDYLSATRLDAKREDKPLVLVNDENNAKYQSFRFLVDNAPIDWKVISQDAEQVVFEGTIPAKNIRVTKMFRLKKGQYHLDMELGFERIGEGDDQLVYELAGPYGLPVEGEIWQTRPYRQMVYASVDTKDPHITNRFIHSPDYIRNKRVEPKVLEKNESLQYAGVMVQFFAALAVVHSDAGKVPPQQVAKVTPEYVGDDEDFRPGRNTVMGKITTWLTSVPVRPQPDRPIKHRYLLYAGPVKVRLLEYEEGVEPRVADAYADLRLRTLTDYRGDYSEQFAFFKFMAAFSNAIGWTGLLIWFTNVMHTLLEWFQGWVVYYGLAIMLLTFLVRMAMFPISRKQAQISRDMQEKMAKLKPELEKLKEKYKDDMQARGQAQMQLYRQHGINPFGGCMGCLVVFLQMPVFMGLYYALNESVHLRLAPFLWIDSLAAPDMLLWWGDNAITQFLHLGPYLNILPIVSIVLMYFHQKLVMPPPADEQQALQMKMMNYMMILFAYMFYWVPSGLCIYFIISSTWGLLERKLLPKRHGATLTQAPTVPAPPARRGSPSRDGEAARARGRLGNYWARVRDWWAKLLEQARKKQ